MILLVIRPLYYIRAPGVRARAEGLDDYGAYRVQTL